MRFEKLQRDLQDLCRERGYNWKVEKGRKHHKFKIVNPDTGASRFVVFSGTANYDGSLYQTKMADMEREMKALGPVKPKSKVTVVRSFQDLSSILQRPVESPADALGKAHAAQELLTAKEEAGDHTRKTYVVRIFVWGRGVLGVQVPKEVRQEIGTLGVEKIDLLHDDRLHIIFGDGPFMPSQAGKDPSLEQFNVGRSVADFEYCSRSKAIELQCEIRGLALVSNDPVPQNFLTPGLDLVGDSPLMKETERLRDREQQETDADDSLQLGSSLVRRLNAWLHAARDAGLEPEIRIAEDGTLKISVVEKKTREL